MEKETIAAIATPPGEGAVAIIRISGDRAFDVAEKVFSRPIKNFKSHTVHYGQIVAQNGAPIDTILLLVMKGPNSYTGEDSVEICCHGGSLVTRKVLGRVFEDGLHLLQLPKSGKSSRAKCQQEQRRHSLLYLHLGFQP